MHTTEEKPVERRRKAAPEAAAWITFQAGIILSPPREVPLAEAVLDIGRDAACAIHVDDAQVSRKHTTLRRAPNGEITAVDEGSRNGTFVNGERVQSRRVVRGDVITLGDSCIVVGDASVGLDAAIAPLRGASAAMRRLRSIVATVAKTPATVLLLAESGCGKEIVARALHDESGVRGAWVAVNGAAIPESLAESQLFGHVANAFTGAAAQPGLFRAAHRGTLFLDEIGDVPSAVQPKLLRALQERMVLPVGATVPVECAARIVAATNRDLTAAVRAGEFRGDLLSRLAEVQISIPPLRERREDVLDLVAFALGDPGLRITVGLAEALLLYPWRYNVRELFAFVRDLRIRAGGAAILDRALFDERLGSVPPPEPSDGDRASAAPRTPRSRETEGCPPRGELERLLREHGAVVSRVARVVGRSRKQVYRWIEMQSIDIEKIRRPH